MESTDKKKKEKETEQKGKKNVCITVEELSQNIPIFGKKGV